MRLKNMFAFVLLAGCAEGPPPFDQLPLRDALRADPEVVASLPERARLQLAKRFEAARAKDVVTDQLETSETRTPAATVVAFDGVRQHRQGEPLIVGVFGNGAAWPLADCLGDCAAPPQAPVLPPIEGTPAAATAAMEDQALEGEAGAAVRALLAASGAHHLYRVVGWPAGAVAMDDTVYVNAAWLVSLAPAGDEKVDGGADGGASSGAAGPVALEATGASNPSASSALLGPDKTSSANARPTSELRGARTSGNPGDAGVVQQPLGYDPQPQGTETQPSVGDLSDACGACASGCDSSSGDSCDSGDDSSDDSGDACASPAEASDGNSADACGSASADSADSSAACSGAGDGADAATCQLSHGRGHKHSGTRLWLCAPLGFLLLGRRP